MRNHLGAAVLIVLFVLAAGIGAHAAAAPAGRARTSVVVYRPLHMRALRVVRGSCWEGSIAADRRDAFRCAAGNEIADPCFRAAARTVACPTDVERDRGLVIRLTAPLPHGNAATPGTNPPWAMRLATGALCTAGTGTVLLGHPYYCEDGLVCSAPSSRGGAYAAADCGRGVGGRHGGPPQVVARRTVAVAAIWR